MQPTFDATKITATCADCGKRKASGYRTPENRAATTPEGNRPVCGFCARRAYFANGSK